MLDQKALDVIRALQREGEPSLLERVIKLYLDSSPKLLRSLRESVEQKDNLKAVHEAAHSLKSSSAISAWFCAISRRAVSCQARRRAFSRRKASFVPPVNRSQVPTTRAE